MFHRICLKNPNDLSVTSLAYLGDSVFELYARLSVLQQSGKSTKAVHRETIRIVSAKGQASSFRSIIDSLSEEELGVYKRGRNCHTASTAKNASLLDYRVATGVETLIGYLFLKEREDRIIELIDQMIAHSRNDV